MSRKEKLSGGEVLGWTLAGLTSGLLGGIVLAAWLGRGNRRRLKRAINQWRPPAAPPRNIATPARSTQARLGAAKRRRRWDVTVRAFYASPSRFPREARSGDSPDSPPPSAVSGHRT